MKGQISKNSTLKWYAKFCVWGQYKNKNPLGMYLLVNITSIIMWGLIAFFFDGRIMSFDFPWFSFLIFSGSLKCIFSIIEKYGELNIGYNLVDIYMLSKKDVTKIRLLTKSMQLCEYIFWGYIVYFVNKVIVVLWIAIIVSIILYFALLIASDIIAIISYRKEGIKGSILNLTCSIITVSFFSISIGIIDIAINNQILISIAIIILLNIVCLFINNKKYMKIIRRNKKSILKPASTITSQLIIKEFRYIFKEKISIIVNPIMYLFVFYLFDKSGILIKNIIPIYFSVEFATMYAFNYLGHDNENLITILLSPVKKECIIRAKNFTYTILALTHSFVFCSAFSILYKVDFTTWIKYISYSILTHSVMLLICQFISIKYYFIIKGKSKYTIKVTLIGISCFASLSVVKVILDVFKVNSLVWLSMGIMSLVLSIIVGIINPVTSAKYLENQERRILDSINNN